MKTGIFAYDGFIDPKKYGDYQVFIANPAIPCGLASQLNAGLANFMEAGCDNAIFIGKNCAMQDDLIQSHVEHLENHLYPLITCGRVLHQESHWKDFREVGGAKRLNLFNPNGTIIQNSSVLTNGYGISIGNFGMNRAAIDRVSRFFQMYFDGSSPLPRLKDAQAFGYGKVLSLCAWCARVTIFMLPTGKNNAVIYAVDGCNPYSSHSCDADNSSDTIEKIGKEMAKRPLDLDFFDSTCDR